MRKGWAKVTRPGGSRARSETSGKSLPFSESDLSRVPWGTVTPAEYPRGWNEVLHPKHQTPGPDSHDDKDEDEEQDGCLGYLQT